MAGVVHSDGSNDVITLASPDYAARQAQRRNSACADLFDLLDEVKDPEIPVLSIWDLGVLQNVSRHQNEVVVTITPTYSGCPAMAAIEQSIRAVLSAAGVEDVTIETRLAPAWTTDWMAPEARRRLLEYGIAPPQSLICPQCGSHDTELVSEFGSTACKALYKCRDCLEPFDYFKRL